MTSAQSDEARGTRNAWGTALVLAAAGALLLVLLRVIVLVAFSPSTLAPLDVAAAFLRVPGSVLMLVLPCALLAAARRPLGRIAAGLVVGAVFFLEGASAHYEAAFGALAERSVLRFLPQFSAFASSAFAAAPRPWLGAEILGGMVLLSCLAVRLRARESRGRHRGARSVLAVSAACLAFVVAAHAGGAERLGGPRAWDARTPLAWFLLAPGGTAAGGVPDPIPDSSRPLPDFRRFQELIGIQPPFAGLDPAHPACADAPRGEARPGNGRSVILLILESVGREEQELVRDGQAVMPNLQRIAASGLSARRFFAAGGHSGEALVSLFAGVPAQTAGYPLWRRPLNAFAGLPLDLVNRGYRTVYLHGGDLAFEQQDTFLGMAGFQELHGYHPDDPAPANAWGYPDGLMFARTRQLIVDHRASQAETPYLVTLATLTTHHPFRLPASWPRAFAGDDQDAWFAESLRYLDTQLGDFFDWYSANEAPRGTLLLLVGDHSPHLSQSLANRTGAPHRLDVAFIAQGLDPATRDQWPLWAERLGGQQDVPATLRGLLDLEPGTCDQGLDLFMPEERWPADRLLHAVVGDRLEFVHVFSPRGDAIIDLKKGTYQDLERGPASADDRSARQDLLVGYVDLLLDVNGYLAARDAYAPPPSTLLSKREPLPRVTRTRVISHRGNVAPGQGGASPPDENRLAAFAAAVAAGFSWVELDLVLTADGIPVVCHDTQVESATGLLVEVYELTLAEFRALEGRAGTPTLDEVLAQVDGQAGLLIEAKPQRHLAAKLGLAVAISSRLAAEDPSRFVLDSFDLTLASRLATFTKCEVGVDLPMDRAVADEWLTAARLAHARWVYVHQDVVTPLAIARAHAEGLKVMVYTVNDTARLPAFGGEWPDGILTDDLAVKLEVERLQGGAAGAR